MDSESTVHYDFLIFSSFYFPDEPGGAEKSTRLLVEGLVSSGLKVLVVCTSRTPQGPDFCIEKKTEYDIARIRLPYLIKNDPEFSAKKRTLKYLIEELRIGPFGSKFIDSIDFSHIIFSHIGAFSYNFLSKAQERSKGKNLLICRDYSIIGGLGTNTRNTAKNRLNRLFSKTFLKQLSCISCNSKAMEKTIRSFIQLNRSQKIRTVYTDLPQIDLPLTNRKTTKPVKACILSRLTKEKGIMEAINFAKENSSIIELHIAGKGTLEQEVKDASTSDNISYLGFLNDNQKYNLISNSDCILIPSIWEEPMPRTLYEGFACGTLVIGNAVGGISEMLEGDKGLTFKWDAHKDSKDHLKHKLHTLINDPILCKRITKRAYSYFQKHKKIKSSEGYLNLLDINSN